MTRAAIHGALPEAVCLDPSERAGCALAYFPWHLHGQQPSTVCERDQAVNLPGNKYATLAWEGRDGVQRFNN